MRVRAREQVEASRPRTGNPGAGLFHFMRVEHFPAHRGSAAVRETHTMSASKQQIRQRLADLGIQPRGLDRAEAAAYIGLSPASFDREVRDGRFPRPLPLATGKGKNRLRGIWDRAALDAALDQLSGISGGPPQPLSPDDDPILRAIRKG